MVVGRVLAVDAGVEAQSVREAVLGGVRGCGAFRSSGSSGLGRVYLCLKLRHLGEQLLQERVVLLGGRQGRGTCGANAELGECVAESVVGLVHDARMPRLEEVEALVVRLAVLHAREESRVLHVGRHGHVLAGEDREVPVELRDVVVHGRVHGERGGQLRADRAEVLSVDAAVLGVEGSENGARGHAVEVWDAVADVLGDRVDQPGEEVAALHSEAVESLDLRSVVGDGLGRESGVGGVQGVGEVESFEVGDVGGSSGSWRPAGEAVGVGQDIEKDLAEVRGGDAGHLDDLPPELGAVMEAVALEGQGDGQGSHGHRWREKENKNLITTINQYAEEKPTTARLL